METACNLRPLGHGSTSLGNDARRADSLLLIVASLGYQTAEGVMYTWTQDLSRLSISRWVGFLVSKQDVVWPSNCASRGMWTSAKVSSASAMIECEYLLR